MNFIERAPNGERGGVGGLMVMNFDPTNGGWWGGIGIMGGNRGNYSVVRKKQRPPHMFV